MEQPHTLEELFGYKVDETAFMRELKPYLETAQVSLTAHANACYYQWIGYIDEAKGQLTCKSGEVPYSLILSHNLLREALNLDSPPVLARVLAYWNYELNAHLSPIIIDKLTSPDS